MSLYLKPREVGSSMAIALCARCQMKRYYGELVQDPNSKLWVCPDGCSDNLDPWRLPPRIPEDITLHHPRPDTDLNIPGGVPNVVPTDPSEEP